MWLALLDVINGLGTRWNPSFGRARRLNARTVCCITDKHGRSCFGPRLLDSQRGLDDCGCRFWRKPSSDLAAARLFAVKA